MVSIKNLDRTTSSSIPQQKQQQQSNHRRRYSSSCCIIKIILSLETIVILISYYQQNQISGIILRTNNQFKTTTTTATAITKTKTGDVVITSTDNTKYTKKDDSIILYDIVLGWYEIFMEIIHLLRIMIRNPDFKNPFRTVGSTAIELLVVDVDGDNDTTKTTTTNATTTATTLEKTYKDYYHRMEQNRHECIRHIRMEHTKLLLPYITAGQPYRKQQSIVSKTKNTQNTILIDSKTTPSTTITLVDPAYHGNVGDHMLTLAEFRFLQNYYYPNKTIIINQCTYDQGGYGLYIPRCKNLFKKQQQKYHQQQQRKQQDDSNSSTTTRSVALWQAGGNWGDLYTNTQTPRIRSFETILITGYDIIIGLPQSLYYKDPQREQDDALYLKQSIQRAYRHKQQQTTNDHSLVRRLEANTNTNNNTNDSPAIFQQDGTGENNNNENDDDDWISYSKKHIILTWREQSSYEKAEQLYPFVTNIVVPDMAFELGPYSGREIIQSAPSTVPTVDIVFFLRSDTESIYNQYRRHPKRIQKIIYTVYNNKKQLIQQQQQTNIKNNPQSSVSFSIYDWSSRYQVFTKDNFFFTNTSIQLLASGKVVIADRLHAVILSYISGLPVYIFR